MLDLGSGVAGRARGWVADRAGLRGVPPTWVWVVGVSLEILEHPTCICDTSVNKVLVTEHNFIGKAMITSANNSIPVSLLSM